jgi:hypothetical protein
VSPLLYHNGSNLTDLTNNIVFVNTISSLWGFYKFDMRAGLEYPHLEIGFLMVQKVEEIYDFDQEPWKPHCPRIGRPGV